jgi:hypothetical protein
LANLIFGAAVLLQLIVVINLAVGIWGIRSLMVLDPMVGGYIGALCLILLVLIEVVAISFYRRKRWAWTAAVAVFALSLPSPVGIVGLVLLFRPGIRQEFATRPASEGDAPAPGSAE